MRERKNPMVKRKRAFIRMSILLVPLVVLLFLSQTVFAQNTYVISDGGRVLVHTSSATDPALVLTEAGLALGADDTYTALTENGISEITVQRAHTVTVNNCGDTFQVTTTGETVGDLLQRLSIDLQGESCIDLHRVLNSDVDFLGIDAEFDQLLHGEAPELDEEALSDVLSEGEGFSDSFDAALNEIVSK